MVLVWGVCEGLKKTFSGAALCLFFIGLDMGAEDGYFYRNVLKINLYPAIKEGVTNV